MITLSKKLLRAIGRTNAKYSLIKDGDKVLLGLSGGADSFVLAHVLSHMSRVAPFDFKFKAVAISYGMGENYELLSKHCQEHEIDFEVHKTNISTLLKKYLRDNSSICSFCSRLRRGALYSYALDNGYNKLALGHHLDDAVESFFMNFSYNGALRSMPPIYRAKNGLEVIRPMIMVRQRQIQDQVKSASLPIIEDTTCPAEGIEIKAPRARMEAKELLRQMEQENNDLYISLRRAFENINLSSFFDKKYLDS